MPHAAETLSLDRIRKTYGAVTAVDDVSLRVAPGRFLTLLGPSGSGKTSLLMITAGFTTPDAGTVRVGDRDVTPLPPERRNFGMVFQGYALFPTMTVRDNIAFPLRLRKQAPDAIRRAVDRMLELVSLGGLGDRMPRALSGGQQQRVALARALVFEPALLLLDEPLSALDKQLRAGLQDELRALNRRLGTTFILVTHDQDEALSMSDEIAIIDRGRIVQQGAPRALYERPVNRFVARFLGKSNFLEGRVVGQDAGGLTYEMDGRRFRHAGPDAAPADGTLRLAIRPERLAVSPAAPAAENVIDGRILGSAYVGADYHLRVDTAIGALDAVVPSAAYAGEPAEGLPVWLSWPADAAVPLAD